MAKAYRKDGKNRKEICVKLGKLSDEAADRWRALLTTLKQQDSFVTTGDNITVTNHFAYLDVAVVNAIWDYWKLDDISQDKRRRDLSTSSIARILTINRCVDPVSKSQTPDWFKKTALPWLLDIKTGLVNSSRVFRELAAIEEKKEAICSHLFDLMSKRNPGAMKSIFYDLSSSTFSGSQCLLMRWGHCKEGYRNHVVLAIVVNNEGLPFYWEVLPGGTADATTITWLLEKTGKCFKMKTTTLVFDRGMVSNDNLAHIERGGIKYISAMDKNQIEEITGLDFNQFSHFTPNHIDKQIENAEEFIKLKADTWYREATISGTRRYILCFNPQLFKDQRRAREQAIADFQAFVANLNTELLQAKKSRQKEATHKKFKKGAAKYKLSKFISILLKATFVPGKTDGTKVKTFQGSIVVDEDKKTIVGRLDGFWLLVTNHTEKNSNDFHVTAQEAISPYREKVIIEAAFRDIKSFVEVSPFFVWTEAHVKAHYTICVLSYLINRTLTLRLHKDSGQVTSDIVSHEKLYAELSGCMIDQIEVKNVGLSTHNMSDANVEQKELLDRIGLKQLIRSNILKKIRATQ